MADDHDAKREARVRSAIIQHLVRFPQAGDTAEGIGACWLSSSGCEDAVHLIANVVETMVAARELTARNLPDGRVLLVRGPKLGTDQ